MVKCFSKTRCRRLRSDDFNLTHDEPALFVISWFGPVWVGMLWNGCWGLYFLVTLLLDLLYYSSDSQHLWLLYITNWGFVLSTTTTLLQFLVKLYSLIWRKDLTIRGGGATVCPWYIKVQWVLYNTNNVTSVLLTSLNYSISYSDFSYSCVTKHLMTSLYVVLNTTLVSSEPVKVFHFYQPMTFSVFYISVTAIVQSQIGTKVSNLVLNWTRPAHAAILSSCVILLIIPLIHLLFYCLYKIRIFLQKKCSNHKQKPQCPNQMETRLRRGITATDVVLDDNQEFHYVDVKPDTKDDTKLKLSEENARMQAMFSGYNHRLNKSETDLRDYRFKNGFYCSFAKSSQIFHHRHSGLSQNAIIGDNETNTVGDNENNNISSFSGSQIIVVKKCKKCDSHTNEDVEDSLSDSASTVSSDFLSQYITEDLMAYL